MGQLTLLLAIHNHQPDGNFGHVFSQAYDDCYRPIVDMLLEFPYVKVALHHTGALYEWIERERPDYFDKLRVLVRRGQVELLGGGFYEPMLAVLPERDALGQIRLMSDYTAERFGVRPEGMWLAERVWEPGLAKLIADAQMKFTLVDDGHFRYAGMSGLLRGHYVTEKAGSPLALFPIDQQLRQAIPFLKAWETIDVLERLLAEGGGRDQTVTYGDDGEKFGVWPHTKEWVWEKGWLREFFQLLGQKRDHIVTSTFSEQLRAHPPTGRVYLPTASYEEMGEWALPAEAQRAYLQVRQALEGRAELERARPFIRGGIWQNFLAKYPEANFMHKKMVHVSDKLHRAEQQLGSPKTLEHARHELYRAQCNCCYWHGLFGGLYLNYLRDAVYRHLIEAEVAADRVLGAGEAPAAEVRDIDADLQPEVLLSNGQLCAYVKPDQGGGVFELDYRPKRFNLLNVLGRRAEGYHGRMLEATRKRAEGAGGPVSIHDMNTVKSAGLEELLVYDRYPRMAFCEHLWPVDVTLDAVARGRVDEVGELCGARYAITETAADAQRARVALRRSGRLGDGELTCDKQIALAGGQLGCSWKLALSGPARRVTFAAEVDLTLLAGDASDRYYRAPGIGAADRKLVSRGELGRGVPLELVNEWDRFVVRVGAPDALLWRHPLETASQSEGGFERTYQASVVLAVWRDVTLGGGAPPFEARVTIDVEPL